MSGEDLARAVDLLVRQVAHWEAPRWASRPAPGPTRGDLVHGLVQRLADAAADAEGRPHRPVPRLEDLILPDQLRVMGDDLLAADPSAEVLRAAAEEVTRIRRAL